MGCELEQEYELNQSPPEKVMTVLEADARGVAYTRGYSLF
ncbi:hypothetical protein COLO4_08910 [Corchorus olitorius]|uniref:Uncharacterized protein n=1 Tax=Corchorus olitorius TaxID=93759 RepID=A0A1R3KE36_9ROSI|nr:hypothetical protein COLO4_08910 [Corchorus olitorius]